MKEQVGRFASRWFPDFSRDAPATWPPAILDKEGLYCRTVRCRGGGGGVLRNRVKASGRRRGPQDDVEGRRTV